MGCDLNGYFYLVSSSHSAELENMKQNLNTDKVMHNFTLRQKDEVF